VSNLYVKKVLSNIKGGVSQELGPRTLIVGPNGSGKSKIVNSIEYACTAAISDVIGREVVRDVNTLLRLGPGDSLAAQAELSDGRKANCQTQGKRSSTPELPDAFPLRTIREVLSGSVETVRKYFLRMASGSASLDSIREEHIPSPLRKIFDTAIAGTPTATPPVDVVLKAIETAKSRQRDLNAQANAAEALVSTMTQGTPPVGEADLAGVRLALDARRESVTALEVELAAAQEREANQRLADELVKKVNELRAELAKIPAPSEADQAREHLFILLSYAQKHGMDPCPMCQVKVGVSEVFEHPAEFWSERLAKIAAKRQVRAVELQQHTKLSFELKGLERKHALLEAALINDAGPGEEPLSSAEIEASLLEAKKQETQATEQVIALERSAEAWAQAKRQRDQAADLRLQAQQWENLVGVLKKAIGELLDRSVKTFCERVQRFLPPSDRFHLVLHDGEREVCQYGFLRPQEDDSAEFHTGLSGGEWARLEVALASAAISDAGELHVIVPADRSWDAETLSEVLLALSNAPAQVILTTTTMPRRVPEGWMMIETGRTFETVENSQPASSFTTECTTERVEKKRGRKKVEKAAEKEEKATPAEPHIKDGGKEEKIGQEKKPGQEPPIDFLE
jgi:energy-coupling factor transporter ATP-binding protein EcfA2